MNPSQRTRLNEALAHHQNQRLAQAEAIYRQLLAEDSSLVDGWHLLGQCLGQQLQWPEAEAAIRRALNLKPQFGLAWQSLGIVLSSQGQTAPACAAFAEALVYDPNNVNTLVYLADALMKRQAPVAEVRAVADKLRALSPKSDILSHTDRYLAPASATAPEPAVMTAPSASPSVAPNAASAQRFEQAVAAVAAGQYPQAEALFKQLCLDHPQEASYLGGLANVLQYAQRYSEAEPLYRQALRYSPDDLGLKSNFAALLVANHQAEQALELFDELIQRQSHNQQLPYDRALALLACGRYRDGFAAYESRFEAPSTFTPRLHTGRPLWDGSTSIAGTRLLVWTEQGLGDAIQFARFLPQLTSLGAQVVVRTRSELLRLFSTIPQVEVVLRDGLMPEHDHHIGLMSLPYALKIHRSEQLAPQMPYLAADSVEVEALKPHFVEAGDAFRVGLVWASAPQPHQSVPIQLRLAQRNLPLELIPKLLDAPEAKFYSLQKNPQALDLARLNLPITPLGQLFDDLASTAAAISQLDLVISVCTSVAHLAGAMKKPVWLLTPYSADWRWGISGDTSPWYPTLRLFRQQQPLAWEPVVAELARQLDVIAHFVVTRRRYQARQRLEA